MNELTVLSTDQTRKEEEQVYACTFVNHRANWVTVQEYGNRVLFELASRRGVRRRGMGPPHLLRRLRSDRVPRR